MSDGSRPAHPAASDNALVTLDDEHFFPCQDSGQRWNGFVCPRFRRPVAEVIVRVLNAEQERTQDPDGMELSRDGDVIVVHALSCVDEADYETDRVAAGADGRYPLGAWGWVWTLAEPETRAVRLRDQRAEGGSFGSGQPIVREVRQDVHCPQCGARRGPVTELTRTVGENARYTVEHWINPCGHVDYGPEVLAEAGLRESTGPISCRSATGHTADTGVRPFLRPRRATGPSRRARCSLALPPLAPLSERA